MLGNDHVFQKTKQKNINDYIFIYEHAKCAYRCHCNDAQNKCSKKPINFKQFIKFLMHSLVSKFQKKEKKGQSPVIKSACFIVCVLKALCSNDLFWL